MGNVFFQPGGERSARVQDLFATVAPRYDLINDLQSLGWHRLWKRRLVTLAAVRPGMPVLDLCSGTGDIAGRLAQAGAEVTAVDFSEAMLRVCLERRNRGGAKQRVVQADALQLPFPNSTFEAVTIGYGLRNLADAKAGLAEMQRVVRPGGRLLVLDFGKPPRPMLRRAYFAYLKYAVPVLGRVLCGSAPAYAYILESLRHYPAQEGVAQLMGELGCRSIRVYNFLGGMMSINYGERA